MDIVDRVTDILSNNMFSNCFDTILASSLLSVVLVPIIKDKCSKINSKDNYRPIALASIVSKNIENILLDRMSVMRSTMSNQFRFKKKHGTDL